MSKLSEKELSSLNALLSEEELLVKKFENLADQATDSSIKSEMQDIATRHQSHFNKLYSHLS